MAKITYEEMQKLNVKPSHQFLLTMTGDRADELVPYLDKGFSDEQLIILSTALSLGVENIAPFAHPSFNEDMMQALMTDELFRQKLKSF